VGGVDVGTIGDPHAIETLCIMLPAPDSDDLLATGTCTSYDRRVIEMVEDLLRGKTAGQYSNPGPISWGMIKLLASR
jgi:hypothetical protein